MNRPLLASEGEAGLENPVLNATGLTLPTFQRWSGPVASMTDSATANAAAAEKVLRSAGFTKGSNGFFQKDGKTVALTIIDPSAYTDYAEVDSIAAQEMKAAGIDATFQGMAVNAWNTDVAAGDFQHDRALVEQRHNPLQHVRRLAGQLARHRQRRDR